MSIYITENKKKLYKVYRQRLDFVQKVGTNGEKGVIDELTIISKELVEDLDFYTLVRNRHLYCFHEYLCLY